MTWLKEFPSTNGRIVATILLMWATGIRYLVWGQPPGGSEVWFGWLALILTSLGVDAAQFWAKRRTELVAPPPGGPVMAKDAGQQAQQTHAAQQTPAPEPLPEVLPEVLPEPLPIWREGSGTRLTRDD